MEITLDWRGDHRFVTETESGVEVVLDGSREEGITPMESLLSALAGCMAIDIVDILTKGREALEECRIVARGTRRDDPPRRFTSIGLAVELVGTDLSRAKAERAIRLSREKYCSVWHTLVPDLEMDVEIEIRS
ncbi:MAG: OsmC family protein [Gemmatimonadota bacterium]|nr:OsmC family protein [Gemmatimonadota bacterium]